MANTLKLKRSAVAGKVPTTTDLGNLGEVGLNTNDGRLFMREDDGTARIHELSAPRTYKAACRVATTANITLSGTQTIDGVAVVAGDRVLVKDQTTGANNGIYECATGSWTRALDFDASNDLGAGVFTIIREGTANTDTAWLLATNAPITLGTTALVFAQLTGGSANNLTDANISATAEIAVSKLADGAARQLLQTDAAGTGVEWTSNVDIPGTLDVTGATTLDSTLSFPLGSAGAPSIYPGTDTDTGIWSPAANALAVSTGGTERLRVASSGRLLIGTSTSINEQFGAGLLQTATTGYYGYTGFNYSNDIYGNIFSLCKSRSSSVGTQTVVQAGDQISEFRFEGSDGTGFLTAVNISARIDSALTITAGSFVVGRRYKIASIGTTDFTLIGASANTVGVIFQATGAGTGTGTATNEPYTNSMPGSLSFGTTSDGNTFATDRLTIKSDGKVGIGTTSPDSLLTVNGVGAFGAGSASAPSIAISGDLNTGIWSPGADQLAISVGGSEKMRVGASGVGFGVSSPGASIDVGLNVRVNNGGSYIWYGSSSNTDAKYWDAVAENQTTNPLNFRALNDTFSAANSWLRVERSGYTISNIIYYTGSQSERLRIDSSGNVGIGTSSPTALLQLAAGTATANTAPLKLTSGTNLTTAEAGAGEYDGAVGYFTNDTTSGRGFIPTTQTFRLTSAGGAIGNTITNFFGTNSNIPIVANAFYEIDIYMLALRGSSAGAATITLTNSAAPTLMLVDWEMSPIAGIVAPPGTATSLRGQATTTTAAYAVTTGSLTNGVNHYFRLKLFLQNGTGTSLKIQMTAGTGNNTMTPQAGSVWFCKRLPGANTGTFAA